MNMNMNRYSCSHENCPMYVLDYIGLSKSGCYVCCEPPALTLSYISAR